VTAGEAGRLEQAYARCRRVNRRHGTTYYWSAQLLPAAKRPHVHALYAFCRLADDVVDDLGPTPVPARIAALQAFEHRFFTDLAAGRSDHPVLAAVVDTVQRFAIDPECFRRFLRSMGMDFTVRTYETYDDLCTYMDGSAAVIGEMMLPVLEPLDPSAFAHARDLGVAFQLTNFLRDVAEDLDRGRVYLPQEDIRRFGADPGERRVTPEWRTLVGFEIERARELYRSADLGIDLLPPRSARCIRAARVLYSGILDEIEAADYDVFSRRALVPTWVKLRTVAGVALGLDPRPARRSGSREITSARRRSAAGTTGARNP
jgi:15-cis-phytoene synthase